MLALIVVGAPVLVQCACASSNATVPPASNDGSAGGGPSPADAAAANFCDRCTLAEGGTKVDLPERSELSGLAASAIHDGVFYTHNDSGDSARMFAIDMSGALLATFTLKGTTAIDWEDVAVGPCSAGSANSCVFLADTGDNDSKRASYTVYRVPEPTQRPAGRATLEVTADALAFRYPDGSHNAEALLVHHSTGRVSLVTKGDGPSSIYLFPEKLTTAAPMTLTLAGSFSLPSGSPRVTAADHAPDGRGILLRTYSTIWFFPGAEIDGAETILKNTPCSAPSALEAQGESVAFLRSGLGYVTVSEGSPVLHAVHCSAR